MKNTKTQNRIHSYTQCLRFGGTLFLVCVLFASSVMTVQFEKNETGQVQVTRSLNVALADTAGANYPTASGDCVEVAYAGGTISWTSPGDAFSSNDTDASVTLSSNEITEYLYCSDFGFSIPAGATIDGITVEVERAASNGRVLVDSIVLTTDGSTVSADDNGPGSRWTETTTDTFDAFGSLVDTWGESYSVTDVNDSGFGAMVAVGKSIAFGSTNASIDSMRMTITYTPAAEVTSISVSGTVYSDEGTTALTSTSSLKLITGTSTPSVLATTSSASGTFTFENVPVEGVGMPISVFVDASTTLSAYTIMPTASTTENLTGFNLYQDHVIVRDNGTSTVSTADIALYDTTDDSDIDINASSSANTIEVLNAQTFYVWPGASFAVTGSSTYSGSFDNNGVYTAGSWTTFTGTSETISGTTTGASTLGNVMIAGSYTISNNSSTSDLWIRSGGSLTAPSTLSIDGNFTNSGTFVDSGGTLYAQATRNTPVLDSVTYVDATSTVSGGTIPKGIVFSEDGMRYFIVDGNSDIINSYLMSTPYDITTSQLEKTYSTIGQTNFPFGLAFSPDGLSAYVAGDLTSMVHEYILEDPFDIATTTYVRSANIDANTPDIRGVFVSSDGRYMYITDKDGIEIDVYQMEPAFSLSNVTYLESLSMASEYDQPVDLTFTDNGLTMVVVSATTSPVIHRYALSEPWEISTATFIDEYNIPAQDADPVGVALSAQGNKLFVVGTENSQVYEYTLNNSASVFSGTLTGTSDLNDLEVLGPVKFDQSASTSDVTIQAAGTLYASTSLTIGGDYVNNGSFEHGTGTVTFSGVGGASSGSLVGTNSFNDVVIANSHTFSANASTTDLTINSGGTLVAPTLMSIAGDYTNNGSFTDSSGTVYLTGTSKSVTGTMNTATTDFNDVTVTGSYTAANSASTTDLTINSGGTLVAPTLLSIVGDYTNNGTFTASTSEVLFSGTAAQTATGTLDGTSQFYDLTVSNTFGDGETTFGVLFGGDVTATNTMTIDAGASVQFTAGATSTFQNVDWLGTPGNLITLKSTSNDTEWYLDIAGSQLNVEYVDVRDSNATSTIGGVISTDSVDSGSNINWIFPVASGSSTISNHDNTQVNNAFDFQNKTNEALFAFKLTPNSGTATVTEAVIALTGANMIDVNDFSNIRLYRDHNADATYDVSDTQVGGAGVMTLDGQLGAVTFTTDFLATTSLNYVLIADWNAPEKGSALVFNLYPNDLTMIDDSGAVTVDGAVSDIQHIRSNKSGGGGGGGGSVSGQVGDSAPVGDGDVGGGSEGGSVDTNTGGGLIGNDPDFISPTANSGSWTNPANAYDATDGTYATDNAGATNDFTDHGFVVPGSNTILGIAVKLEVSGTTAAGDIDVDLSWDGGTSWTSAKTTPTLSTTDTVVILGSAADLWGRTWASTEFSDANFVVRITGGPSSNTVQVDAVQVRVYNQASGGGSGGGGGGGGGGAI